MLVLPCLDVCPQVLPLSLAALCRSPWPHAVSCAWEARSTCLGRLLPAPRPRLAAAVRAWEAEIVLLHPMRMRWRSTHERVRARGRLTSRATPVQPHSDTLQAPACSCALLCRSRPLSSVLCPSNVGTKSGLPFKATSSTKRDHAAGARAQTTNARAAAGDAVCASQEDAMRELEERLAVPLPYHVRLLYSHFDGQDPQAPVGSLSPHAVRVVAECVSRSTPCASCVAPPRSANAHGMCRVMAHGCIRGEETE